VTRRAEVEACAWPPYRGKRLVDLALLALVAVPAAALGALCALAVRLDSRGPVLFHQERVGMGGRPFVVLKFRTMVDEPNPVLPDDARITRVGRVLRRLSLDELPQLLNVVRGEMSLVGPRPSPFRENQICIPWRDARLSVPPGITGLWQVCRDRSDSADFHQWIHFDLLYVNHATPWLDLKILLATALTLAGRRPVPLHWLVSEAPPAVPHGQRAA